MTYKLNIYVFILQITTGPTTFQSHFEEIVANAPVDEKGEPNEYYSRTFMPNLVKYFLPQAPLWSGLMLGKWLFIL